MTADLTSLAIGDRVRPWAWGYGVPLWLANSHGTVVGKGRTRVKVRFDDCAYAPGDAPHSVAPQVLRVVQQQGENT